MTVRPASLWRHADFVKFWSGQSVSLLGSQFTLLALPLAGAITLHASPAQMGLLGAVQFAPALLLGLPAGVWLDRVRRRPVMVAAQLASAAVLATVPLAAAAHLLTLWQLYGVSFAAGATSVLYTVGGTSYLPTLVGSDHLVEANSRFQTSRTVAQMAGPGLAGWLVQAITAPLAVAVDAASFVVGGLTTAWVRTPEAAPAVEEQRHLLTEVGDGLAFLWAEPLVRATTLTLVTANLGSSVSGAAFVLLFVGHRGVTPAQLGLVFALASVSSLVGAQIARPILSRGGLGPVLVAATVLFWAGWLPQVAAAFSAQRAVLPLLVLGTVVTGLALMTYNISQVSIRQAVIPNHLRGRAQGSLLVLVSGGQVLGSLLGGAVGQLVGLRWAIVAGAALVWLCIPPTLLSPLRSLRDLPAQASLTRPPPA
jgi:MFS family permease